MILILLTREYSAVYLEHQKVFRQPIDTEEGYDIYFSKFEINRKFYGGSERKIGIEINESNYIVKFRKNTEFSLRNNHICEYIGCEVFRLLDFKTQEVILGTYGTKEVIVLDVLKNLKFSRGLKANGSSINKRFSQPIELLLVE